MSFPLIVKQRPVCVHCASKCGRKYTEQLPWDGESWFFKYNPFCTLRCALSYARLRYVKG